MMLCNTSHKAYFATALFRLMKRILARYYRQTQMTQFEKELAFSRADY
jgi:hypothetical protein